MARMPASALRSYLLGGRISTAGCLLKQQQHIPARLNTSILKPVRTLHTETNTEKSTPTVPFRKQLKTEAKLRKAESHTRKKGDTEAAKNWELTVGIEIHAQLNTARKLFSSAASTINDAPNTHVALFDVAIPGSQPTFQKETLIPAIRAALALNCKVEKRSKFDRKHYFHWDQPSGYQITQYYEPYARDGYITLYAHDGIAKEDGNEIRVGIKQIQMEQDTAKTTTELGGVHLLDFNRAGLPLIEIITLPQIHHPRTAVALVQKIQILLNSVDACVLGMQSGGLRADVNVSVRKRGNNDHGLEYGGVKGLGQRTEIKNLGSFKAVEDAIIAERDRQIKVLEAGGVVEGETRGWTIGGRETVRLRGKEGEVDYRLMPDPDLGPVIIGDDLVHHLKTTLGVLPEEEVNSLVSDFRLTTKDAMSLVSLDDGERANYFYDVVDELGVLESLENPEDSKKKFGVMAGNWVLHELKSLDAIPFQELAALLHYLHNKRITGKTAKRLLLSINEDKIDFTKSSVKQLIDQMDLWFIPLTEDEYMALADQVGDESIMDEILNGKESKVNYLVGQMIRAGEDSKVDPTEAAVYLRRRIEAYRLSKTASEE